MKEFLERVVPWPGEQSPGYVGFHWIDKGRHGMPGKICRTSDQFVAKAAWNDKHKEADVYFCTALLDKPGADMANNPASKRKKDNTLSKKCLHVDIDVKEGAYASLYDGLHALFKCCHDAKIPTPNWVNRSGGGFHVYWITAQPMPMELWHTLSLLLTHVLTSHGVLHDSQCTIDYVRVLRPPGTLNWKTDPPRKVRTLFSMPHDYEVAELANALLPYSHLVPSKPKEITHTVIDTLGDAPLNIAMMALKDPAADLVAGGTITREDIALAASECGFLKEAFETGGKEFLEPVWRHCIRVASFVTDEEEGRKLAHEFSKGHPKYAQEDTDKKFNEALKHRNLGWPRYETIIRDGYAGPVCPDVKGPLNAIKVAKEKIATAAAAKIVNDMALPDGYVLERGLIARMIQPKDTEKQAFPQVIISSRLSAPYVTGEPRVLHFNTCGPGGKTIEAHVPSELMQAGGSKLHGALGKQYVDAYPHCPHFKLEMERFLMAWLSEVERVKGSVRRRDFGWSGEEPGFAFAGKLFMPGSVEERAGGIDASLSDVYMPTEKGELKEWKKATDKLVFDRATFDGELLLAASFGAPIMKLTGQPGGMLCAYSNSGYGKTSYLRLGAAAWCDHKRGPEKWDSTTNAVLHKLGKLGDIPVYWDDLADKASMKTVSQFVMTLSAGTEKSRMTGAVGLATKGEWASIGIVTSNHSPYEVLNEKSQSNSAAHNRILEFEYQKPEKDVDISGMAIDQMLEALRTHRCQAGIAFSKHLANLGQDKIRSLLAIEEEYILKVTVPVADRIQGERVWRAMIASIVVGATLANDISLTRFRIDNLRRRLVEILMHCRDQVVTETDALTFAETELSVYLQRYARNEVVVNNVPMDMRGVANPVTLLYSPDFGNGPQQAPVYIRWSRDQMVLHINRKHFWDHLAERNIDRRPVTNALASKYNSPASLRRARLGTGLGTAWTGGLASDPILEFFFDDNSTLGERLRGLLSGRTDLFKLNGGPSAQIPGTKAVAVGQGHNGGGRPQTSLRTVPTPSVE